MTETLLTLAERDVEEGRQCLAGQEELVRDLLRYRCSPDLLILAQRLLNRTREHQALRERHLEHLRTAAGAPAPDRSHRPIEWFGSLLDPGEADGEISAGDGDLRGRGSLSGQGRPADRRRTSRP